MAATGRKRSSSQSDGKDRSFALRLRLPGDHAVDIERDQRADRDQRERADEGVEVRELLAEPIARAGERGGPGRRAGDRQCVGSGESESVRVDLGGRRVINRKTTMTYTP